ncbi:hypothetical protein V1504DRAFT_452318 [Lipomyces starkeyi]
MKRQRRSQVLIIVLAQLWTQVSHGVVSTMMKCSAWLLDAPKQVASGREPDEQYTDILSITANVVWFRHYDVGRIAYDEERNAAVDRSYTVDW